MNARRVGVAESAIIGAIVACMATVAGALALAAHEVPDPIGFWPLTVSGWIGLIGSVGGAGVAVYFIFGPFLKERLRVFLGDKETARLLREKVYEILESPEGVRLLQEKVCDILETPDGGRLIRDVVTKQFLERIQFVQRIREELSETMVNFELHAEMLRRHEESMREISTALRALPRIEEQGKFVRQQVRRVSRILESRGSQIDTLVGEMSKAALGRREHPRVGPQPPTWMQQINREFAETYGPVDALELIDTIDPNTEDDPRARDPRDPDYRGDDQ